MNTPAEINLLLTELRKKKGLNFFTLRLIDQKSDGKEGSLDYTLNLFLLKVVTEGKEYWALEGASLQAFKELASNFQELVNQEFLQVVNDALVTTEKTYILFIEAIKNFYPEQVEISAGGKK